MKLKAVSAYRYRASADERRQYGGSTVTDFYIYPDDRSAAVSIVVRGYGRSPSARKTDALRRVQEALDKRGGVWDFPRGTMLQGASSYLGSYLLAGGIFAVMAFGLYITVKG